MNEERNDFERRLTKAMGRVDAPEELTQKLMAIAAVAEQERRPAWRQRKDWRVFFMPKLPVWASGAMAAVLVAAALLAGDVHVRHEQERVRAQREFETASRITDRALEHAREQLAKAGVSLQD